MGFERIYNYDDAPTIREFNQCDKFFRLLIGPFGCISEETPIVTDLGLVPIADIDRPMQILSWNDHLGQFQFSLSGSAFPKGKDYLYRVITQQGEFVAAGHHRVLCVDNKYRQVQYLQPGQILSLYSPNHFLKLTSLNQILFLLNDRHLIEKFLNYLDHYEELIHQYDLQSPQGEEIFQEFFQLLTDVQKLSFLYDLFSVERMDDLEVPLLKHIHQDQLVYQKQTGDYSLPVGHQYGVSANHTDQKFSAHTLEKAQQFLQLLLNSSHHHTTQLLSELYHSCSSSLSNGSILEIERDKVKRYFWDIKILNTNNYVSSDGTIHHNSGKSSGCVAEIVDRGVRQEPSPDGVRRTKWAAVRNTFPQLTDTTMATFFYWLPFEHFGTFNKTEHRYIINKIALEDGTRVEIEVLFRALDKEDHVRNLLSLELTGAWFNEVREMPKIIVDAMEGRCSHRYPKDVPITWNGVIADTNPPDQSSWIFKRFEEELIKGTPLNTAEELQARYAIFKQPSGRSEKAENLFHLGHGNRDEGRKYYTNMAIGKDPEYVKVYIDGEYGYVRDGKPVYGNYMDSIHCAEKNIEAVSGFPIIMSWDFGLTPAVVMCQYLPNGKFNVLHEFYEDNCGVRSFVNEVIKPFITSKYRGYEFVTTGDPAGRKRNDSDEANCFRELKSLGFPATPASTNSPLARINSVDSFLTRMVEGKPAFQLSPCCELLRRGFIGEYKLHKLKGLTERISEVPTKNEYSHIHDALQYACLLADKGIMAARGAMGSRYDTPVVTTKPRSMAAWV